MSTFSIFEIGRSALIAAKRTMDVTSHNVANAATPGYSRQEAVLEPIIQRLAKVSGAGVKVTDIRRTRDQFIDSVLRSESAKRATFAVGVDVIEHLQVVASEPSDGSLRVALDQFWSAWHDLSVDANSASARAQVMERGRSLVDMFRHLDTQIDALEVDVEAGIDTAVRRVNILSHRIAELNVEISRALSRGDPGSDLLDRRDLLLDELCELTGATVSHISDGQSVRVAVNGFPLVDGNQAYELAVSYNSGGAEFRWVSSPGEHVVIPAVGGRLAGYRQARDEIISGFRSELEGLLRSIVDGVNEIHAEGHPIEGSAGAFFEFDGNDCLGTVRVSQAIIADPRAICASGTAGDPLDGSIALRIADLLEGDRSGAEPTFNDTWSAIVGRLGTIGQKMESGLGLENLLVKELQNRRDAVSGVSIDEEVATLVRQQHAFTAASRLITVADEMIDTIINRMGTAGR